MRILRCYQVDARDNVATLIDSTPPGPVECLGQATPTRLKSLEPISRGHKIALRDISTNEAVIKFGVRIGRATRPIKVGEWVHLHNIASDFDQRSATLDPRSGVPTDTSSAYV